MAVLEISPTLLKKSPSSTFTRFRDLPPELRFRIWEEALSVWSVWAAAHHRSAGPDQGGRLATRLALITMAFIGPAPYLAGLASREAWWLMKRSYGQPIRAPSSPTSGSGVYWVDLERTVVFLGNSGDDAAAVMDAFGAEIVARFKHVVLLWHQFTGLARICQRLARSCPSLRTIILRQAPGCGAPMDTFHQPLQPGGAAYYASLADCSKAGPVCENLDTAHLRLLLVEYFDNPHPKMYLLPPGEASRPQ